jgi:hypothetical protein
VQLIHTLNLLVNEGIFGAQGGVSHDLVENCDLFIILNPILVVLVNDLQMSVLTLHPLVYLGKV